MPNQEFYPDDFPVQEVLTPEQLIRENQEKIKQTLYQGVVSQREANKVRISAVNASLITGERMPSPSVSPDLADQENAREYPTLKQYREMQANWLELMRQIQQWQANTIDPDINCPHTPEC